MINGKYQEWSAMTIRKDSKARAEVNRTGTVEFKVNNNFENGIYMVTSEINKQIGMKKLVISR